MKVFALLVLVPLSSASQLPYGHPPAYPPIEPAYAHPAPAYAHHAPAYAPVHHAPVHHAPVHHAPAPGYGYAPQPHYPQPHYEHPKHNCSVQDVIEPAEVCTPAFETVCSPIELVIKKIVDKEQCYPVTRTVCTESIEEIENEICTYSYQQKAEGTTAKTVVVTFEKVCKIQMVTVCQPAPQGYGHGGYGHGYGHNYCQEVAQETCYNVPVVTVSEPAVEVAYPEPIKTCVYKPISLVRISCEDLTAEKCITVPEVEEAIEVSEKCITQLAAPACQNIELTLPKQVCVELVYGHAEDTHTHEPAPAYAPAAPHHA